jgi:hypothetical protein
MPTQKPRVIKLLPDPEAIPMKLAKKITPVIKE